MIAYQKKLYLDLKLFVIIIAALIIIGSLFIYSSSSVFALEKCGSAHYFVKKQLLGVVLGTTGMIIFSLLPLQLIKTLSPLLFLSSLVLTALTFVPSLSYHIHGSSRWLNIAGLSLQPSELLKYSLILYLAYFLTKKERNLRSFRHGYLPFLCILLITALILLKQPDFGMAVTLCTTAAILFFIVHFNIKYILVSLITIIPTTLLLIYAQPYRWKRILTFLNPWHDPQGAGFQIIQSLIAIGSGGWLGTGVAHSKQKFFYLPMQHTDFIFSIIAEETGFIGSCILITLYFLVLYFGLRIALQLYDTWCSLCVVGFVILITLQTLINLAVTTGLIPTKGIGLPFVSYGNSALIAGLCMVGIVVNCVRENRKLSIIS